jgi:hypothetical protein
MATGRRRRRWFTIGGAAAAVGIFLAGAVALAAPTLSAPAASHLPVNLSWSDSDSGNLTGYTLTRTPGTCAAPSGSAVPLALPIATQNTFADSTATPDGHYCYSVAGTYSDNPTPAPSSADVWVDTADPTAPTISFSPAPSGSALKGTVTVTATSSDPGGSGVVSTTVSLDGAAPFATGTGAAPAIGSWPTSGNGSHTLTAVATDAAGNPSSTILTVNVLNTPPSGPAVSALQPVVTGSPTLMWPTASGITYTVARTSSTGPGPHAFTDPVTPNWTDPDTLMPGTYTYVVTATDNAGNSTPSAPVSVVVIAPSVTAPRSISANSPTNSVPHLTWQPPVTFAVTSWDIYRDGTFLTTLSDPSVGSFDDTGLTTQGSHIYTVQAMSGSTPGDMSSPVSVIYDTTPPTLDSAAATATTNGSIALSWPPASDPSPGSGVASYVVRRSAGALAPGSASSGTAVCTLTPPATGCLDSSVKNNTFYSYGVFAIDGAGNVAERQASAKASDTQGPDPVTGLRVLSFDRNYARLSWTVPPLTGNNADLAGYRVLELRPGAKAPLNPNDGTVVCPDVDPTYPICDALHLKAGKKVWFAVYAYDEVPNYSFPPAIMSMTPHAIDHTPPHKPTKVKLVRTGARWKLTWVSPRDADLSHFRVTLYPKGPALKPSIGKAIVTGRVLKTSFTLKPGQIVYVNLFALDVSGNFSRVTRLIVMPNHLFSARSKHKVKKTAGKKTPPKKPLAATTKKKS